MQPTPFRLQQAIWTAFKAAKPAAHANGRSSLKLFNASRPLKPWTQRASLQWLQRSPSCPRWYSSDKKPEDEQDIRDKIQDAQSRVNEAIESRADRSSMNENPLKQDETIIHTAPESSSIVYSPETPGQAAEKAAQSQTRASAPDSIASTKPGSPDDTTNRNETSTNSSSASYTSRLPSHLSTLQSTTRARFTHFMDHLQTHIFTASRRLNDLTGYTAIDQLKRDIESQESLVRSSRAAVRSARHSYSTAVDTRSATQREVNDLLHRKHAWSPTDLERFTNLYRSDHANELAEQAAHEKLLDAEKEYEAASQKLSQGILARYHEEQVWSDKIRQMSTWGTWGLMGLNVLLFIVFQILVEPWRRRRLVRGFEDKVEEALRVRDERDILMVEAGRAAASPALLARAESEAQAETVPVELSAEVVSQVENSIADSLAESVASAVTGTDAAEDTAREQIAIEAAAEDITTAEVTQSNPENASEIFEPVSDPLLSSSSTFRRLNRAPLAQIPATLLHNLSVASKQYQEYLGSFFDAKTGVIMTRREFTSSLLESAFFGALGMAALFWCAGVGRR